MLRKILRGAGSEDVELEEKASQMLHGKCGKGDFVLQEHNPAEFPELEAEERMDSGLALSLDVTWLRSALFMPHRVVSGLGMILLGPGACWSTFVARKENLFP
jgi:hypothetical protein